MKKNIVGGEAVQKDWRLIGLKMDFPPIGADFGKLMEEIVLAVMTVAGEIEAVELADFEEEADA